jgi:endonuclease-3
MDVRAARDWLETLPGVGPQDERRGAVVQPVRRPALPVDSHHHRVAQRLGLLPQWVDVGPAHAWLERLLPADWTAQQVYDHHEVLMLHGQKVCFWRTPACGRCVVVDLCPTGRARTGAAAPGPLEAPAATVGDAAGSAPTAATPPDTDAADADRDLRSGEPLDRP